MIVLLFTFSSYADIISWVDKNGVRHFSNTGGPSKKQETNAVSEQKSRQSKQGNDPLKNLDAVYNMYRKDINQYDKNRQKRQNAHLEKKIEARKRIYEAQEKARKKQWDKLAKEYKENRSKPDRAWLANERQRVSEKAMREYYRTSGR